MAPTTRPGRDPEEGRREIIRKGAALTPVLALRPLGYLDDAEAGPAAGLALALTATATPADLAEVRARLTTAGDELDTVEEQLRLAEEALAALANWALRPGVAPAGRRLGRAGGPATGVRDVPAGL